MLIYMEDAVKQNSETVVDKCPCGAGCGAGTYTTYASCCQPYHLGKSYPETAEQLMRSRYSAYALKEVDYLYETTHPSARHPALKRSISEWASSATFLNLTVRKARAGLKKDKKGIVEFIATYSEAGRMLQRHEVSLFEKVKKRWYYVGASEE